jgi:dTDP-3-amino-3,4,6-trideoxy-alpha-D-glucose transaminase
VLRAKLPRLAAWNRHRAELAARYTALLADTGFVLPEVADGAEPSWHLYVVRVDERDVLRTSLLEAGVETLVHYPTPPHLQPCYARGRWPALAVTRRLAGEVLSLPIGPHLGPDEVEHVARTIHAKAPPPVAA